MKNDSVSEWLKLALSDIKSSKLLYDKKLFSQSYFHFQQACEKSNKAFWMLNNMVAMKGLKVIGHDQLKPINSYYRTLLQKVNDLDVYEKNGVFLSEAPFFKDLDLKSYTKSLMEHRQYLSSLKNKDLSNLSNNDLDVLYNELRDLQEPPVVELPNNLLELIKEGMEKNIEFLESFVGNNFGEERREWADFIEKTDSKKLLEIFKKLIDDTTKLGFISITFFACTLLTVQHNSKTRYPEAPNWLSPLDFYTPDLPIVSRQMVFVDFLENAIRNLMDWARNNPIMIKKDSLVETKAIKTPTKPTGIDGPWEAFGIKSKNEFITQFFVPKNTHSKVPEDIVQELKTAEDIQLFSLHNYRLYDDAFARLTRVFEMSIKVRAGQMGKFQKGDTLAKSIDKISGNYPSRYGQLMHWGRKMRNMGAHPSPGTLMGSFLKLPMLRMTNLINDLFREKEFLLAEIEKVRLLKSKFKGMSEGLWKCGKYLIYSVEILAYKSDYTLWVIKPVGIKFPQKMDEIFHEDPLYIILKDYALEGNNMVGVDVNGDCIVLEKTIKKANVEKLQSYKLQMEKSQPDVKETVESMIRHSMKYEIESFKNKYNT